jgi:hypothetical protein
MVQNIMLPAQLQIQKKRKQKDSWMHPKVTIKIHGEIGVPGAPFLPIQ